jgi:NTP pyrophosphatase (non-canonical NTP hydrolase)
MKKMQRQVNDWIKQTKIGYFKPLEALARLTEEVGELAREINHTFGVKKKKLTEKDKEIADEMGDIIFTLICMANPLGIDLGKSFNKSISKLHKRDKKRWEKK